MRTSRAAASRSVYARVAVITSANVPEPPAAASADRKSLRLYLDGLAARFETAAFLTDDPVQVPHRYTKQQDVEIAGFLAATFAWGQRPTIIAKTTELLALMDDDPHAWIVGHREADRARLERFVHRTFQPLDALYFVDRLQRHYRAHASLEDLFADGLPAGVEHVGPALRHFHDAFFDVDYAPQRTRKHVATPARKSSCKRLNMFLRWMVRPAAGGVDFGLWRRIAPRQLVVPLDLHVQRVARSLGLLTRKQADWQAALELTAALRALDPEDPARYDYALFGLGVLERYG